MHGCNFTRTIFFLIRKSFLTRKQGRIKYFCHPIVFTKKSKIWNTRVCGYTLDLICLVCPARDHVIWFFSFFPVKTEMLYKSCTNIFLFQSHVNFNILTHFLNANFEKSLHGCRVCPTCKRKLLLIIKANAKNWGFFFIFLFFPTDRPFKFWKKIRAPGN